MSAVVASNQGVHNSSIGRLVADIGVAVSVNTEKTLVDAAPDVLVRSPSYADGALHALLSRMARLVRQQTELIRDLLQYGLDDDDIKRCTDNYRHLRNACVAISSPTTDGVNSPTSTGIENNDGHLPSPSEPILMSAETEQLVVETVRLIERFTEGNSYAQCDDRYLVMARLASQFLGNLIVKYKSWAQLLVWTASMNRPRYWPTLLRHVDDLLRCYSSMVLYNLLLYSEDALERLCSEAFTFVPVIDAVFQNEAKRVFDAHHQLQPLNEWNTLICKRLFGCDRLMIRFYRSLSSSVQDVMLELLIELFNEQNNDSGKKRPGDVMVIETVIHPTNVLYFSSHFVDMCKYIDWRLGSFAPHSGQMAACRRSAAVLAAASVQSLFAEQLRVDRRLFDSAVDFLKRIVHPGQQDCISRISAGRTPTGECRFDSLQQSLVRLIGNLCHRNAAYQQLAVEVDALYPVLECTVVVDDSPFLGQWAVFAIRQLCENCPSNQSRLYELSSAGTVIDRDRLLQTLGGDVSKLNDSFRRLLTNNNSSDEAGDEHRPMEG